MAATKHIDHMADAKLLQGGGELLGGGQEVGIAAAHIEVDAQTLELVGRKGVDEQVRTVGGATGVDEVAVVAEQSAEVVEMAQTDVQRAPAARGEAT